MKPGKERTISDATHPDPRAYRTRRPSTRLLLTLLLVATASRLTLQILAMPPYAGLDELFHVARLSFTAEEQRDPKAAERSVPRYLAKSAAGDVDVPPAFGILGARWPELLASRALPFPDPRVTAPEARSYDSPNYEAQQPGLYYRLSAPLVHLLGTRTREHELLLWRFLAVACAALVGLATAGIGARSFGTAGLIAGALLASTPAWLTLVARAGNDAFACAALAWGLFLSGKPAGRTWFPWLEGVVWAIAIASKAYTWPFVLVIPVLWPSRARRASRAVPLLACCLVAGVVTCTDLYRRTGHLFGDQGLTTLTRTSAGRADIDYLAMVRVFLASAIWPGGQHGNALTPVGTLVYLGPPLVLLGIGLRRAWRARYRRHLVAMGVGVAAFLVAQVVHAYGFVRQARAAGSSLPAGGMEGWYAWSGAALVVGMGVTIGVRGLARRPLLLALLVVWWVAADVTIHEGGLFRDYAGLTTRAEHGAIFRWGALPGERHEMLDRLALVGAGHPPPWLTLGLRGAHLACTAGLMFIILGRSRTLGLRSRP
ncbi:MAG TPA: hypothetical protein VGR00_03085 [Thermoanaerobaculia bacterium]|nr:hypothetical protein [Thermoanaerobaculia bacterium]